jgi:ABC-type ATPase involved in cell division
VADTLDRFNIVGKKDLFPSQLSGGQQQLVGVARAVIHKPALLLADEPTGELDEETGEHIASLFDRVHADGTAIIVVTHNASLAARARTRLTMRSGTLRTNDERRTTNDERLP